MLKNIKCWAILASLVAILTSVSLQATTAERDITDFSQFVDSFKAQLRYIDDRVDPLKEFIGGELLYAVIVEGQIVYHLIKQRNPQLNLGNNLSLKNLCILAYKSMLYEMPLAILKAIYHSLIRKNSLQGRDLTEQEIKAHALKELAEKINDLNRFQN